MFIQSAIRAARAAAAALRRKREKEQPTAPPVVVQPQAPPFPDPAPTTPSPVTPRSVQPVYVLAKDDPAAAHPVTIYDAFLEGRRWWKEQTGRTFDVEYPVTHRSQKTRNELVNFIAQGNNLWFYLQREAHNAGVINNTDPTKCHYMVIPFMAAGGGMVGSENFGAPYVLPGKACISGKEACVLLGIRPQDYGFDAPVWWFDERREAIGALMHELGHCFGDGVKSPLPHTNVEVDGPSVMWNYWDYPNVGFTAKEVAQLEGSPFLN